MAWGKDNAAASGLADRPIRWLVDDCAKFVAREKRRGNTYDGIIMDPPSYGRGPGGEIWKLEDCIYDLISQCEEVLSDTPLFFAVNSYTTGLSRRSWSICSRPRWCPVLAARPAATRSACRSRPPAAWCPAAQPPSGKNKERTPLSRAAVPAPRRGSFIELTEDDPKGSPFEGAAAAGGSGDKNYQRMGYSPFRRGAPPERETQMSETILTAENLKFRYDPEQPVYALDGVSPGKARRVRGRAGCQRLRQIHAGQALQRHPAAGERQGATWRAWTPQTTTDSIYDIRQTVGMVFQNPDNQIVATVVEEDVAFALENLGVPPDEMRRRVDDAMKMAASTSTGSAHPTTFPAARSSALPLQASWPCGRTASSWTKPPPCWTPGGREQVMQTIHYLNRNMGITVVSITHYMEEAAKADRVLVMSKGMW